MRVCALKDDLKQFPYGDMTEVGDRGNSLSGGQKVKVLDYRIQILCDISTIFTN